MIEQIKKHFLSCCILPCAQGTWLIINNDTHVLFNYEQKPIRICKKRDQQFIISDIEIVSDDPVANLIALITN